jgi:hypothetical protein
VERVRATLRRSAAIVVLALLACSSPPKPPPKAAPPAISTADPTPPAPPAPPEPWPATRSGASWSVVEWTMNASECETALKDARLTPELRTNSKTGRVEALEVKGMEAGWKATIAFDEATTKVRSVVVRGDSITIESARRERARLDERLGAPKETSIHRSRQWETKAVEISGDRPSWRVTQSLLRSGDAKTNVEWPTLSSLAWGMSVAQTTAAMKTAGFAPEKIPPPPKPKPPSGKRTPPKKPEKPILPPTAPRGAKLVELTFKKGEEHVLVALVDKTGLFKVSIAQDASDRKTAERRASELAKDLGPALSEAETESSLWETPTAIVRLSITGFQGQRIVFESYRNPKSDLERIDE